MKLYKIELEKKEEHEKHEKPVPGRTPSIPASQHGREHASHTCALSVWSGSGAAQHLRVPRFAATSLRQAAARVAGPPHTPGPRWRHVVVSALAGVAQAGGPHRTPKAHHACHYRRRRAAGVWEKVVVEESEAKKVCRRSTLAAPAAKSYHEPARSRVPRASSGCGRFAFCTGDRLRLG